jgi:hypothetical protein
VATARTLCGPGSRLSVPRLAWNGAVVTVRIGVGAPSRNQATSRTPALTATGVTSTEMP